MSNTLGLPTVSSSNALSSLPPLLSVQPTVSTGNTPAIRVEELMQPYLNELKSRIPDIRFGACARLEQYLESSSRDMSYTQFHQILNGLNKYVFTLVNSADINERIAGIALMCMLLPLPYEDVELKLQKYVSYLRMIYTTKYSSSTGTDEYEYLIRTACVALGQMCKSSGALATEIANNEAQQSISMLQRSDKRYSALMICQSLAVNVPTMFNAYVSSFLQYIWLPLKDIKPNIRLVASDTLYHVIKLISTRAARLRPQRYETLYNETQKQLQRTIHVESIHAGLLALTSMLSLATDFVLPRIKEIGDCIWRFRDSKEKVIREQVLAMLPKLAAADGDMYYRQYTSFVINTIKLGESRDVAFRSLGELSKALGPRIEEHLAEITALVQDNLINKKNRPYCPEAVTCLSQVAQAVGELLVKYLSPELLDMLMRNGLSTSLVQSLANLCSAIPQLLSIVQPRLLTIIGDIFSPIRSPPAKDKSSRLAPPQPARSPPPSHNSKSGNTDQQVSATDIHLALQCLAIFPFAPTSVASLLRVRVVQQLQHDSRAVRLQAVKTSVALLSRITRLLRIEPLNDALTREVVQKLLSAVLTDTDGLIRRTIIEALFPALDELLAQPQNVSTLFVALNDEVLQMREACINLIGRLASSYPTNVVPYMRQTVTELITQLQMNDSSNIRQREESARLLRALITSSNELLAEYVPSILSVLIPRLQDIDSRVAGACLAALAALADIAGEQLQPHLDHIVTVVLNILQDKASTVPRDLTLRCMAQIIRSTGDVIHPYETHSTLMPTLLSLVRSGQAWHIRREVLRLLGVLGALDPFKYRNYQAAAVVSAHAAGTLVDVALSPNDSMQRFVDTTDGHPTDQSHAGSNSQHALSDQPTTAVGTLPSVHPGLSSIGPDYYSNVAVQSLMRVLRDPTLAQQHGKALQAAMLIMRSVGQRNTIKLLPVIMPTMIAVCNTVDDVFRATILTDLTLIVSLAKQHLKPYTTSIYGLIRRYWRDTRLYTQQILPLLERVNIHLPEQFASWLPSLLPEMLLAIYEDKTMDQAVTVRSMKTFEVFGASLDIYLHLLTPVMLRVAEQLDSPTHVRMAAVHALGSMAQSMNMSQYASRIVQPLLRVLEQTIEVSTIPGNRSQLPTTPGAPTKLMVATPLADEVLNTLCMMMIQMQYDFLIYMPAINRVIHKWSIRHELYDTLSYKLLHGQRICYDDQMVTEVMQNNDVRETHSLHDINGLLTRQHSEAQRASAQVTTTDDYWDVPTQSTKLPVNVDELRRVWNVSERSSVDDWIEWQRSLAITLLRESPMQPLRHCVSVALKQDSLGRDLFNAAFISCWAELSDKQQDELIRVLEIACQAVNLPPELAQTILNLAEFMERDDQVITINRQYLSVLAERNLAYAKALHYKELEFQLSPVTTVESLISLHNQLQQPDAAYGLLTYAETQQQLKPIFRIDVNTSWYESLNRWEDALNVYEYKQLQQPDSTDVAIGRMRCLRALGEWPRLHTVCTSVYDQLNDSNSSAQASAKRDIAPYAAAASWRLGEWDDMSTYLLSMDVDRADTEFYRAILAIHSNMYDDAKRHLESARQLTDPELTALMSESYQRAYKLVLSVQQAEELEEVIEYKQAKPVKQQQILRMWNQRLQGVQADVDVWQQILSIRSLVVPPQQDMTTWLKFSSLCRKSNRLSLSLRVLTTLLSGETNDSLLNSSSYALSTSLQQTSVHPRVAFSYVKHLYSAGMQREALHKMKQMSTDLLAISSNTNVSNGNSQLSPAELSQLRAKVYMKVGQWQLAVSEKYDETLLTTALQSFESATHCSDTYKVWNQFAFVNYRIVSYYKQQKIRYSEQMKQAGRTPRHAARQPADKEELAKLDSKLQQHVLPAVQGFFKSISYSSKQKLQDLLRLLSLWFEYGMMDEVERTLSDGFNEITVDIWLAVVPQIIARIDSPHSAVRKLVADLLIKVGKEHPQALLYPLTVTAKSVSNERQATANTVLDSVREHSAQLVDDALMVSSELIRIAVLWHEQWFEALGEASKAWFGQHHIDQMVELLQPLYDTLGNPQSLRETAFVQLYGYKLKKAWSYVQSYQHKANDADISAAWDLYLSVYRQIDKSIKVAFEQYMDLNSISPVLTHVNELLLAMPGTFLADRDCLDTRSVLISSFVPSIRVIDSKQKPRKLQILGNDGAEYSFLLKGREDLRQDKRVMQLLGLVNQFLHSDRETGQQDVSIKGYAVIPLAPNSGLIQWLSNCDTIHALVKQYREARNKLMNIEHALIQHMAPDYITLPVLNKVEVFEMALNKTTGNDLQQLLWLTSSSSEVWLDRRTSYSRSLGVMSMVGYVLGLGDRHPCNLMIERGTGKVVHIDFGDCFEVAMKRERFPELIPFRLTRMLTQAMEVSGIIGTYTTICNHTMRLMRDNKESIMAVLEAFVYDPLISWRLVTIHDNEKHDDNAAAAGGGAGGGAGKNKQRANNMKTLPTIDESNKLNGTDEHTIVNNTNGVIPNSISDHTYNTSPRPGSLNRRISNSKHKKRQSVADVSKYYDVAVNPLEEQGSDKDVTGSQQPSLNSNAVSIDTNSVTDNGSSSDVRSSLTYGGHDETEVLNARALEVIGRVDDKLNGRDFSTTTILAVSEQVDLLLREATSNYNLAQCYIGWCPFW